MILRKFDESNEARASEETENETVKREDKRKKSRLRRRGPYRKAHANW
jgi:hypothetical protein